VKSIFAIVALMVALAVCWRLVISWHHSAVTETGADPMPRPHLSDHQKLAQARAEIARLRKAAEAKAEPLTDATRRKLEGELMKVKLENDRLREQLAAKAAPVLSGEIALLRQEVKVLKAEIFGKAKTRKKARKKVRKKTRKKTRGWRYCTVSRAATISIFADRPQRSELITVTTSGGITRSLFARAGPLQIWSMPSCP
jgi:hypothetical protein